MLSILRVEVESYVILKSRYIKKLNEKILIIGGGAMGSAFSIPCLENNNKVTITEPYNKAFIKDLSKKISFNFKDKSSKKN